MFDVSVHSFVMALEPAWCSFSAEIFVSSSVSVPLFLQSAHSHFIFYSPPQGSFLCYWQHPVLQSKSLSLFSLLLSLPILLLLCFSLLVFHSLQFFLLCVYISFIYTCYIFSCDWFTCICTFCLIPACNTVTKYIPYGSP